MDPLTQNNISGNQKRRLINAMITAFVLLSAFLAVLTLNAIKDSSNSPATNVIAVNGTGEVFAVPDIATLSFSVSETAKTVGEAQDIASKKINSILDAVKKMGIEDRDIKTIGYNSYPKYEYSQTVCVQTYPNYCPPGKQVLTGYEVSQTISVKVRKTADAGAVLSKVGELDASNISGLDFVIDDLEAVQAEARDKAVQDAKAKAKVLAKSLGVKLNKIVNFYEGSDQPVYYGMALEGKAVSMGRDAVSPPPQVPTGENKIVSSVTITYEVE